MMEQIKDASVALAVFIIALKPAIELTKNFFKPKSEHNQNVIIASNGNGNKRYITKEELIEHSRIYASQTELAKHSMECSGQIYDRINGNYTRLAEQINENHKETMSSIANINVSIAHLESMKMAR